VSLPKRITALLPPCLPQYSLIAADQPTTLSRRWIVLAVSHLMVRYQGAPARICIAILYPVRFLSHSKQQRINRKIVSLCTDCLATMLLPVSQLMTMLSPIDLRRRDIEDESRRGKIKDPFQVWSKSWTAS
jgi:hypothetical protein